MHRAQDPFATGLLFAFAGATGYALSRWASAKKQGEEPSTSTSIALVPRSRNASFWAVKTPGVILDEMRKAKSDIEALGRDISSTFAQPFEVQLASATQRFAQKYGRRPGVGRDARDDDDKILRSLMQPSPTDADWEHKSYQGAFVAEWRQFEQEFGAFWADHDSWSDRMWRGTYDTAVEFQQRALAWRQSFIALGGSPTTPTPKPSVEEILPGVPFSLKTLALVGGLAVGALLVVPAALRSRTSGR